MTLETAVLVLVLSLIGIVLVHKNMRKKRKARIICFVLLSLLTLACAAYIGLTLILLDAIRNQPPSP